jgi:hypothetical protein
MVTRALKVICLGIFLLMLAVPAMAQNTKGDKPTSTRESRIKKGTRQNPARRIRPNRRTTTSLRAYKPGKKSKGGERAGRPTAPLFNSKPSERAKNVHPQISPYMFRGGYGRRDPDRSRARKFGNYPVRRIVSKSSTAKARNVYPQPPRFMNYSSVPDRKPTRKRRVVPRSASRSYIARRSVRSWAVFPKPAQKKERAYTRDIAGRKLRTKNYESRRPPIIRVPKGNYFSGTPKGRNVYSNPNSRRVITSRARRSTNVYPQTGKYVTSYVKRPRKTTVMSNRATVAKLDRLQSGPDKRPKKRRVVPRSASRPYISRRSPNAWANFPRPKKKGERAITTDLAGHRLLKKNYETKRPSVLVNPTARLHKPKKKMGEKAGGPGGGYKSASRSGRAWRGDVTNRRIRKNFTSKRGFEGQPVLSPEKRRIGMRNQGEGYTGGIKTRRPLKGGGSVSGRAWNNKRQPVPVRQPVYGKGAGKYQGNIRSGGKVFNNQGEEYSGNVKTRRPLKGGGSVSGRLWNNKRQPVPVRTPVMGRNADTYSGNLKTRRALKGGGSVSGRLWNNKQQPVPVRTPGYARDIGKYQGNIRFGAKVFQNQGEEFSGNIKSRRPLKGGGSVSGKLWNNKRQPVPVRTPVMGRNADIYSGNLKAKRPLKGGGSVSGRPWNNKQQPVPVRTPGYARDIGKYQGNIRFGAKVFQNQGEEFSGNIKTKRPLKGGGSVSGKLWNNKQQPVPVRQPVYARGIGKYQGNIRFGAKVFQNQGEEFTGNIKTKRPLKGGGSVSGKLWNNKQQPVPVRQPVYARDIGKYQGNIRFGAKVFQNQGEEFTGNMKNKKGYVKNPNSAEEALKVRRGESTFATGGLQVKVKQAPTGHRKGAPEGSMPVLRPTKSSFREGESARGMKQYKYVQNRNTSEAAMKVREPGKAFARAGQYQGNIKMKKFDLFGKRDLHPDAKFVKINKNNVAEEKDVFTNFKLWWARLFKKNDTQPDHLKDKGHRPRYDKGEAGLWYD